MKKFDNILLISFFLLGLIFTVNAQPTAPANLKAAQQSWGKFVFVTLNWNALSSGNMTMRYNIYRKEGSINDSSKFLRIYPHVRRNSWNDKFVQRGKTYTYYVTAVNNKEESQPSNSVQLTIDSNLTRLVITGTLKDASNGSSIANGRVALIPVFGWGLSVTKTDTNGFFKLNPLPGTYLLYTGAEGYIPVYYNNKKFIMNAEKIKANSGDSLNFDITLEQRVPPAKYLLSGTVLDSLNNPVKAFVQVYKISYNSRFHRNFRTVTDSAGKYSLPVFDGDTVVVFAAALSKDYYPEFYNNKQNFLDADRIAVTGDITDINFVLEHKAVYNNSLSGYVNNVEGEGIESLVQAIKLKSEGQHPRRYSTTTDSLGNYSFSHLIPGTYILMAVPRGGYKPTFFKYDASQTIHWKEADSVTVAPAGDITDINFTVISPGDSGSATIHGVVKDNNGSTINGAMIAAKDDNQQVYSFAISDKNGEYTIAGLIPGTYTVTSDDFGYTSDQSATVSVDYVNNFSSSASFTLTPETVTSVSNKPGVIQRYEIEQNYPNPFNPSTTISYQIPSGSRVTIKIYNILGNEIATLVDEYKPAGSYNFVFNASNLASGVYFYKINAGNFTSTKKLILIK